MGKRKKRGDGNYGREKAIKNILPITPIALISPIEVSGMRNERKNNSEIRNRGTWFSLTLWY